MAHAKIIRPVKLTTTLPEDLRARLDLLLYSEAENRVPKGAIQEFLVERIREYFSPATYSLSEQEANAVHKCVKKLVDSGIMPEFNETEFETCKALLEKLPCPK